jgi:UDP-glucose 4-epimerase
MNGVILLTGGCGFIGSHIYDALRIRGESVLVVDDLSTGTLNNLPKDANVLVGSVSDRQFLETIFSDFQITAIVHQAARINTSIKSEVPGVDVDVSVMGTINLLNLAVEHSVSKFVYASSVAVYGRPRKIPASEDDFLSPIYSYGIAKLSAEHYVDWYGKTRGMNTQILRYSNIYGPRQFILGEVGVIAIFTKQFIENKHFIVFGDGQHLRDYLYVEDAVDGTLAAFYSNQNGIFNVASGIGTSTLQVVDEFRKYRSELKVLFEPERDGELGNMFCDTRKINQTLGWQPKWNLSVGIQRTIDSYVPSSETFV